MLAVNTTSSTWYPNSFAVWFDDNDSGMVSLNPTEYTTGWHLLSFEWDGNTYRCYKDGTEYITINESTNPFSTSGFNGTFYLGTEFGSSYGAYNIQNGVQRIIFYNGVANGAEITPIIPTSTPTLTSTPTRTPTFTPTITLTATLTATQTFTAVPTAVRSQHIIEF
jgi:hypothetical protein